MSDPKRGAADWQKKIYLNGIAGIRSDIDVDFLKVEEKARSRMSPEAFAYIAGGAGMEDTIKANRHAFEKYKVVPRVLCDVSDRDTSIELLGQTLAAPLLFSPIGALEMVHREADLAVGRAAAEL